MGDPTDFFEYQRKNIKKETVLERIKHFQEFEVPLADKEVKQQAGRCMSCGVPFCNWGCPVDNLIPEFNDFVSAGQWKEAYNNLQATNNFPEFTGRICPAPCEPACCAALPEEPITIKQIEFAIIEKAFQENWVQARKNIERRTEKIAIVGSGPAGLAVADQLNSIGYNVSVFEKNDRLGGLLMYGIPSFKLEKKIIQRRISILQQEGIYFFTNTHIGKNYSLQRLEQEFDYICLCCGAEEARPLEIDGSDKKGIYYAMDFLTQQNKIDQGDTINKENHITAYDKNVVVLGGGDTGSDCVGTSIRQGCRSVTQIQIHKKLPVERYSTNPWPHWPKTFATSSSHEEGAFRIFSANIQKITGKDKIEKILLNKIQWPKGEIISGQRNYTSNNKNFIIDCDLLLISLGFRHTIHKGLVEKFDLLKDKKGNIVVENFQTNKKKIYACGDMVEGANLVVTAIKSGRMMAKNLDKKIQGFTLLT